MQRAAAAQACWTWADLTGDGVPQLCHSTNVGIDSSQGTMIYLVIGLFGESILHDLLSFPSCMVMSYRPAQRKLLWFPDPHFPGGEGMVLNDVGQPALL